MKYKLLAIDLDDTLLKHDLTISKRNTQAIRDAVAAGVKVTLASGRATPSVRRYLEMLGLEIPVITYQGARVVDTKTGKAMYEQELEVSQALPVIRLAEELGIHCNLYINDNLYIAKENELAREYHRLAQVVPMHEVGKLSEFLDTRTTKIILIDDHEKLEEVKPKFEEVISEDVLIFFSKPNFLEITNKHASKGAAVKFLGEHLGISREEIMIIGDTYNDISMIEYAGMGVCMANGPEDVRALADYVTLSNEEDGVAHAIEKFIL